MTNNQPRGARPKNGDGASLTDRPTTTYVGVRTEEGVTVAREEDRGRVLALPMRHDLRMHADGFEWGYAGGGPAQLALAVLSDAVGGEKARECYQKFKFEVIAALPQGSWSLTREEVIGWYKRWLTTQAGERAE